MTRRIFDTFLFDGELTLLAHRLKETADLVDIFVIVEAGETFRGDAKPLDFAANRALFAGHADKIRHIALPRLGRADTDPWAREQAQRDAILFALHDLGTDDIVLLLDADEIPSRAVLKRLRHEGLDQTRRLLMTRHYEAVDRLAPRSPCCPDPHARRPTAHPRMRPGPWDDLAIDWFSRSGVAAPAAALRDAGTAEWRSPHAVRRAAPMAGGLPDAGRHLCFVDPSARPDRKLGRVAHAELAGAAAQEARHLARCRRHAIHHRGWWFAERPDGRLPDDLARLIAIAPDIRHDVSLPPQSARHVARLWARWRARSTARVRA